MATIEQAPGAVMVDGLIKRYGTRRGVDDVTSRPPAQIAHVLPVHYWQRCPHLLQGGHAGLLTGLLIPAITAKESSARR